MEVGLQDIWRRMSASSLATLEIVWKRGRGDLPSTLINGKGDKVWNILCFVIVQWIMECKGDKDTMWNAHTSTLAQVVSFLG